MPAFSGVVGARRPQTLTLQQARAREVQACVQDLVAYADFEPPASTCVELLTAPAGDGPRLLARRGAPATADEPKTARLLRATTAGAVGLLSGLSGQRLLRAVGLALPLSGGIGLAGALCGAFRWHRRAAAAGAWPLAEVVAHQAAARRTAAAAQWEALGLPPPGLAAANQVAQRLQRFGTDASPTDYDHGEQLRQVKVLLAQAWLAHADLAARTAGGAASLRRLLEVAIPAQHAELLDVAGTATLTQLRTLCRDEPGAQAWLRDACGRSAPLRACACADAELLARLLPPPGAAAVPLVANLLHEAVAGQHWESLLGLDPGLWQDYAASPRGGGKTLGEALKAQLRAAFATPGGSRPPALLALLARHAGEASGLVARLRQIADADMARLLREARKNKVWQNQADLLRQAQAAALLPTGATHEEAEKGLMRAVEAGNADALQPYLALAKTPARHAPLVQAAQVACRALSPGEKAPPAHCRLLARQVREQLALRQSARV